MNPKMYIDRVLPPDVAAKYRCVTIRPGKFNFATFGEIDLRTISVKKADELYQKGFPFFVLIEPKPKSKKEAKNADKESSENR